MPEFRRFYVFACQNAKSIIQEIVCHVTDGIRRVGYIDLSMLTFNE